MSPYEIIARKRDGHVLSDDQIRHFVTGYLAGDIADYQMSALLMAIYWRGMTPDETVALTRTYIESGRVVDLSAVPGVKVDKHSTGGVGDKVSILLAPIVAAAGVPVPMISGRGLGHSGGTLDKLESIPGFNTQLSIERFVELVATHRLGLIGQTQDIVPADKHIYALRDVTATIECIPLIAASIMSKKIAEGIDALVLDVKFGNGAFMKDLAQAETLSRTLIDIGRQFGKEVVACLTAMEQPLGLAIGNWLEIRECLDGFAGGGPADLMEVTLTLAAHMVLLGGGADDLESARTRCQAVLDDGSAFERFMAVAAAQGADTTVLEHPERYPEAAHRAVLTATRDGYVTAMDAYEFGLTAVSLGAGRARTDDVIDPAAGILLRVKTGDRVAAGDPILEVRSEREATLSPALERLAAAVTIGDDAPEVTPPVHGVVR